MDAATARIIIRFVEREGCQQEMFARKLSYPTRRQRVNLQSDDTIDMRSRPSLSMEAHRMAEDVVEVLIVRERVAAK